MDTHARDQHSARAAEYEPGTLAAAAPALQHTQPLKGLFARAGDKRKEPEEPAAGADGPAGAPADAPAGVPPAPATAPQQPQQPQPQQPPQPLPTAPPPPQLPPPPPPPLQSDADAEALRAELEKVRAAIAHLEGELAELPRRVAEAAAAAVLGAVRGEQQQQARESLQAKTIDALVEELAPHFALSADRAELRCGVCAEYGAGAHRGSTPSFRVAQPFHQLRRSAGDHADSKAHRDALDALHADRDVATRRLQAGLNVARVVYKRIMQSGSYLGFEDELVLLDECKADVGTLNHSDKFASALVDAIYIALHECVKVLLSTPCAALVDLLPPFRRAARPVCAG